jgi:hypothetical protein
MTHDPGDIRGYVPGVRENGGKYTHAALWTVIALARLGLGDEAMALFHGGGTAAGCTGREPSHSEQRQHR